MSRTQKLDEGLLVTGFAYDIRESSANNLDHFARFALCAQGIRRTGTAALDLCYVAAGRFDGFWELKLHPWDTAAGVLIVAYIALLPFAYGGLVTNFYLRRRLPAPWQHLLEAYTNFFGIILWRVFSADLVN